MHELNKNQLVLLVLLVSFVTSIATGIITTTLLQEAPPGVTQVINRVVQQTIEKVTPGTGDSSSKDTTTVVVSEEDQVTSAISKNLKSLVRIQDNALVNGNPVFYGMGFLLTSDGLVVSANSASLNTASTFSATFSDGTAFAMKVAGVDTANNLAFFKVVKDPKLTIPSGPAAFSSAVPVLGQSVIALDGQTKNVVAIGRITSLDQSDPKVSSSVTSITTDITTKPEIFGGPLTNLSGEIMGIRTMVADGSQMFVPSIIIRKDMTQYVSK